MTGEQLVLPIARGAKHFNPCAQNRILVSLGFFSELLTGTPIHFIQARPRKGRGEGGFMSVWVKREFLHSLLLWLDGILDISNFVVKTACLLRLQLSNCLISNREGLGTSLWIMGLATIEPYSDKVLTKLYKIPKFGVKRTNSKQDTAIWKCQNLQRNVWSSGRCPTKRPDMAIHFFVNSVKSLYLSKN